MKLIIGIGNPGSKYHETRHNIGFMCLDAYAKAKGYKFNLELKFKGEVCEFFHNNEKIILLKPLTYVNLSGEAVNLVQKFYKIALNDILVIYDDLDLAVGLVKVKENGSAAGHNGIKNLINHLHTQAIKRIKIGIGKNPTKETNEHVLGTFNQNERPLIDLAIDKSITIIDRFINNDDFKVIMSQNNQKNRRKESHES